MTKCARYWVVHSVNRFRLLNLIGLRRVTRFRRRHCSSCMSALKPLYHALDSSEQNFESWPSSNRSVTSLCFNHGPYFDQMPGILAIMHVILLILHGFFTISLGVLPLSRKDAITFITGTISTRFQSSCYTFGACWFRIHWIFRYK